jgi:hypothetical protein
LRSDGSINIASVEIPKVDPTPSSTELGIGEKASIVRRFFESTPSQLSMEGLFHMHSILKEDELAILFRNNHFSTITKHNNTLYSLITDIGYMHDMAHVWETLSLTGDVVMVDATFSERAVAPESHFSAADYGFENLAVVGDDELVRREQAAADAALARKLQEQENAGRVRPTGRLTRIGYDEYGRELLVDEVGVKFHRPIEEELDFWGRPKRDKKRKDDEKRKDGGKPGEGAANDSNNGGSNNGGASSQGDGKDKDDKCNVM